VTIVPKVKGSADVGEWLVREGHAWSYRYRRDTGPYAKQQAAARAARKGLFATARPEEPRDFRKRHGACGEPVGK
jgi:micrococcal nuclease